MRMRGTLTILPAVRIALNTSSLFRIPPTLRRTAIARFDLFFVPLVFCSAPGTAEIQLVRYNRRAEGWPSG